MINLSLVRRQSQANLHRWVINRRLHCLVVSWFHWINSILTIMPNQVIFFLAKLDWHALNNSTVSCTENVIISSHFHILKTLYRRTAHKRIVMGSKPRLISRVNLHTITQSSSSTLLNQHPWSIDDTPNKAWVASQVSLKEILRRKIFNFENSSNYSFLVRDKLPTLLS